MLSLRSSFASTLLVLAAGGAAHAAVVRSGAGAAPTDILTAVDQYRVDLGTLNPNQPGSFGTGRREINWDGVPDNLSDPNLMPGDFFNGPGGRARGVVMSTPGLGFTNSADSSNPTDTPRDFGSIHSSYADEFEPFSAQRLFTPVGSNVTDVRFFIPGSAQQGTTRGFGAIFSDVDLAGSAYIEYYDASDTLILTANAPAAGFGQGTYSFVGASFDDAVVSRVRIISGTAALGAGVLDVFDPSLRGSTSADLVVLDDFIYGEPVPAPAGALALAGMAGAVAGRRRRA